MDQSGVPEGEAAAGADCGRRDRAPRDSLFLQGTAWFVDPQASFALRIRNLSASGMMADCDRNCGRGDVISVDLRGVGIVHGRIAWRANGRIGVAFDNDIDPMLARRPVTQPKQQGAAVVDLERTRRPALRTR